MKKLLATACLSAGLCAALPVAPADAQASDPFLGQMMTIGFNFCPRNWLPAHGQLLAISQYSALFALLGCTYGGDCRTTFALPDTRGRVAVGVGQAPGLSTYTWGVKGGSETNTMTVAQMPAHTHTGTVQATDANSTLNTAAGTVLATGGAYAGKVAPNVAMAPGTVQTDNAGGSQPVNNLQPFLAQFTCIATQGIFPSRP